MNGNMQKKLQQLQSQMMKAEDEVKSSTFEGVAAGGLVKIVMSGNYDVQDVNIKQDAVSDDISELEDMLKIALQDVIGQIDTKKDEMMSGFKMPGGFGF